MEDFKGQKFKSPGNVMNCPEINKKILTPTPPVGGFRGQNFKQKSGKFDELPRKSIHFFTSPTRTPLVAGGFRGQNFKVTKHAIILSEYTANIPGEAG